MYQNGLGVERNVEQALVWYEKAVESGNIPAANNIGALYCEGGLRHDLNMAEKWFRWGAERGDAVAQQNLARLINRKKEAR